MLDDAKVERLERVEMGRSPEMVERERDMVGGEVKCVRSSESNLSVGVMQ